MASKGFEEARRKCEHAAQTKHPTLDLSGLALTELPRAILKCSHLRTLILSHNRLAEVPAALLHLTKLWKLDLGMNPIRKLPAGIVHLSQLENLALAFTDIEELPPTLASLPALRHLAIGGTALTDIRVVERLVDLRSLWCGDMNLGVLPNLQNLQSLTELTISNCGIAELPSWLGEFKALVKLHVPRNPLHDLPIEIGALRNLKDFRAQDCPLSKLPPEIVSLSPDALLAYLRDQYESGALQWISKLLIVGEGAVGKTSLLRRLRREAYNRKEPTTHGIRIKPLEIPHPTENSVIMELKSWDFGGQQIYHATHQFFLTNRSLFLLVWNARLGHEQGRLSYWLDTIRARAPESPVLLVATHVDERSADLPLADLRARYPQIVDHFIVSNETNQGIDALREAIRIQAAKLPLMGERWPRTWLEAANSIRALAKEKELTHTTPQKLWAIMKTKCVHEDRHRILATWLHELGDILFFQDNPELENIVLLDPHWATEAISRVLECSEVIEERGIFTRAAMDKLWSDIDSNLRDYLLRLMEQFDLSYRTEDNRDKSIVVERLSHDAPPDMAAKFDARLGSREVRMRFQIDGTMPAGIPTWFIARSHRFTTRTHFRRGALFADGAEQKHLAVVRASLESRSLELSVRGPAPHAFFTLLRDGLELTLERFPGLPVTRLIPCPGHDGLPCNHEFKLEYLEKRLEKKRSYDIECPEAAAGDVDDPKVDVREMLFGLTPATLDDVHRKLEQSLANDREQKEMIRSLAAMVQRNHYLSFRGLQRHEETHCPSLFVLRPASERSWTDKLLGQSVELHLVCEQPGEAHLTGDSGRYKTKLQAEWLAAIAPYITKMAAILKCMAPLISATTGYAPKPLMEMFSADLKLMDALIGKLPTIALEEDAMALGSRYGDESLERMEGATLRLLRNLLDKLDKERKWGGLQKVLTMEGDYLWLCEKHAAKHRM